MNQLDLFLDRLVKGALNEDVEKDKDENRNESLIRRKPQSAETSGDDSELYSVIDFYGDRVSGWAQRLSGNAPSRDWLNDDSEIEED